MKKSKTRYLVFLKRLIGTHFFKVVRITIFLILIGISNVFANSTYSQTTKFTFDLRDISLGQLFNEIQNESEYNIFYKSSQVDLNKKVNISTKNLPVEDVLKQALEGMLLDFKISNDKQIVIFPAKEKEVLPQEEPLEEPEEESLQQKTVSGLVTDSDGHPLPGVTVVVKGTTHGTVTGADGNYTLSNVSEDATLIFSFVGMKSQEIGLVGLVTLNVTLREELKGLEEVVIVGYGVQKKATVTGAIASMDTEQLLQSPQANISNALVGRIPGLLAVQRSGEPGNDQSTLRIRGIGTFSGSQDPLIMVDGIEVDNYNNLDPNEIENITVLKDASATAVYGVRGANGVLLITTKRGKVGKPKVSITANTAISRFTDLRQTMGSYDYTRSLNEALKYDSYITGGYTPAFTEEEIEKYKSGLYPVTYPSSDWEDLVLKPLSSQFQGNFTISGGTPKVKYFVSAGYFSQEGMFRTDEVEPILGYDPKMVFNRYNFRSNFDFQVTDDFSIDVNISSQFEEKKGFNLDAGILLNALFASPVNSPGIYDGKLIVRSGLTPTTSNPLYNLISDGYHHAYNNHLNGSIRLNYDFEKLIEGLSAHATVSYQNYVRQDGKYEKGLIYYTSSEADNDDGYILVPNGFETSWSYSEWNDKNRREYLEFGVDYARSFGGHNVTAMGLYKQSKYYAPYLAFLIPNGHQGLAGRITYDYKKRYLVEFNVGYEGTENFAKGQRFGFFPAASLGWVISEENFFPENDVVSYLKIRGTMGQVGNDNIGNISDTNSRFLYRPSSFIYSGGYYYGEVGSTLNRYTGSVEGKIGNPDLTWEKSTKYNLGFEINLLKNSLEITADWFKEERDNILANRGTIPDIVGANLPAYNLGKMENSGFEVDITYRNSISKLNYWFKANYTYAHNVVEFMDEVERKYDYQYSTGLRYGQYFGLIADGFYNTWDEVNDPARPIVEWQNNKIQPGDIKYKDINGDGYINSDDWAPIGYSNFPEKIFAVSLGGDFKGFDFSVLFQGAGNVSMLASARTQNGFSNQLGGANIDLLDSWTQEKYENGEKITRPHLSVGGDNQVNNYLTSTFWVNDASYLRLKNAEIGYTFSNTLTRKLGLGDVRVYINASNLYTWSHVWKGLDPEAPDYVKDSNREPYPVTSTYNLGLKLNF